MTDPVWLDETESAAWRGFLELSARVRLAVETALKDESGMSLADYEVLVHLSEAEGRRLRMSELSDQTVHSQSRLSQRIDRLVRRGWIVREPCHDDRRGTYATLTEAGLAVIIDAAPGHLRAVRKYFVDLIPPDNIEEISSVCHKLTTAIRDID